MWWVLYMVHVLWSSVCNWAWACVCVFFFTTLIEMIVIKEYLGLIEHMCVWWCTCSRVWLKARGQWPKNISWAKGQRAMPKAYCLIGYWPEVTDPKIFHGPKARGQWPNSVVWLANGQRSLTQKYFIGQRPEGNDPKLLLDWLMARGHWPKTISWAKGQRSMTLMIGKMTEGTGRWSQYPAGGTNVDIGPMAGVMGHWRLTGGRELSYVCRLSRWMVWVCMKSCVMYYWLCYVSKSMLRMLCCVEWCLLCECGFILLKYYCFCFSISFIYFFSLL